MLNQPVKITVGEKEVVLVGTAHVSKESIDVVRKTIDEEKPDVVAVELCDQRHSALADKKKWDETEIHKVIKEGKGQLFLMQLLLTNFQRKIGDELGVKPGSEMVGAMEAAKEKNIPVALVDRDIKTTLKRAFNNMTIGEKLKLFYGFFAGFLGEDEVNEELIEKLKEKDVISEMMEDLGKEIPSIKKTLVDERDAYIASKIAAIDAKKVVAVVGAGHVSGIHALLESGDAAKTDLAVLESVREKKSLWRYVGYAVPLLFFSLVVWGFYSRGLDVTLDMLLMWFLINGSLSALGVVVALGHPFSAITAFVAAPFTSLNPTIAAGWFAGAVEGVMRKPRVKDFDGLMQMNGWQDYWRNNVTRILLVIAFANLGSSIATFIALPYIASLLMP